MKKIDVVIFGGQSNMQGQSECLTSAEIVQCAYEYKFLEDTAKPLKNPVGENIKYDRSKGYSVTEGTDLRVWLSEHVTGSSCYGNTNLVPAFCRKYIDACEEEIEVLASHSAKGSTQISEWLPGTKGYEILVDKGEAAIAYAKQRGQVGRIFFVWLQGESDAIAGVSKDVYKKSLMVLNQALRTELGIERFGIIRVGRFTRDERDMEIICAQDEICNEQKEFLMLTEIATELNEQEEYMNPYVKGHYSAKGLEKLGAAAGRRFAEYRNGGK